MTLFPTSIVGSYPQPDWLIDRAKLAGRFPPRVRAKELWRPAPEFLAQAQDDATRVAIRAQEEAGLDIVTDGEIRRESYSNHFATALSGVDIDSPGEALDRSGHPNPVPRVAGDIVRSGPIQRRDLEFLRAHTDRTVKITVPGPFTMSQQAQDDHYGDPRALALAYADAVNQEVKDLFAAGADIVQLDEPYMQARPEPARKYGVEALNRALDGVVGTTAVHICFGYAAIIHERPSGYSFLPELADCTADQISVETAQSHLDTSVLKELSGKTIILGVIDLSEPAVETAQTVVERTRRALQHVQPERIVLATDCGMKYLPRDSADGKMRALSAAARILRARSGHRSGVGPRWEPGSGGGAQAEPLPQAAASGWRSWSSTAGDGGFTRTPTPDPRRTLRCHGAVVAVGPRRARDRSPKWTAAAGRAARAAE
jgi:5-methyltetrahydropteroyltriglutamate--homocysteine methyltransferase